MLRKLRLKKWFSCKEKRVFIHTQREKAPSDKTQSLSKSMNMGIWVVGSSNQLFIRDS